MPRSLLNFVTKSLPRKPDTHSPNHTFSAEDILSLLLAGIFLLAGCGKQSVGSPIPDSPYKVIDTGYWNAEVNPLAEPLWLDNERIIFTSTESLTPGKRPYSVKVWNIKTGKIVSMDLESVRCVRDGQVVYMKKGTSNNSWIYYRGPLENAKEHPAPGPDMKMDEVFDCDWVPMENYNDKPLPHRFKLHGENYVEILEARTRLFEHEKQPRDRKREKETGDLGTKGKFIYHHNANDPGRAMPPHSWDGITYSEYLDAYAVGMNYYDPREPETRSFWILQRNGDLKEITYPKTTLEGRNALFPVKPGYLVHYNGGPLTEEKDTRGLYLIQGEQVQRLIIGVVHHVSISPDGCKAAFIQASNVKEDISTQKPYRTVKLINFCQGGVTP